MCESHFQKITKLTDSSRKKKTKASYVVDNKRSSSLLWHIHFLLMKP